MSRRSRPSRRFRRPGGSAARPGPPARRSRVGVGVLAGAILALAPAGCGDGDTTDEAAVTASGSRSRETAVTGGAAPTPAPESAPAPAPAPAPGPAPAPDPARAPDAAPTSPPASQLAASRLTPAQLVGQRLVASFRGTATPPPALLARIRRGEVAGVVLFAENASTVAQAGRLARSLQAVPRPAALRDAPLLIMVDQEGGLVRRLADAPPRRSALAFGRAGDGAAIEAEGVRTGRALRRAGITVNLAPVTDVPRPGSAMLREQRTYGTRAADVRRLAPRAVRGLLRGRVQATAKHFPGFGAATVNTDDAPATIGVSRRQLRAVDERAVRDAVAAGAGLVMLSNAIYPALDPRRPATLSRAIATTELRRVAGFRGVSITDDLEANALRRYGAPGAVALASARAGADLLVLGRSAAATEQAARSLLAAARDGRLPRAGLVASAERVLALRRATAP